MDASPYASENLTFEIELEKDTFLSREPVWVDLYFTNEREENATLDCLDLCWQKLRIHVVNSGGDTLEYSGYIADGICPVGPALKPSETYHHSVNLSENFGIGARQYLPPPLRYFEEDAYTLQMTHSGVSSNLIRLKVRFPKGEEKLAYDLVKDASRNAFKYYDNEAHEVIGVFEEIVNKYPKSAYVDLAYYEIAGLYGLLGQPDKTTEYLRELISNSPNSHFVAKALPELLRAMTEKQKPRFLKEIIERQPKTRASDWARKFLENLNQKEESNE
jgi:tetratricopeptide (TPR) repeat protein